MTNKQILEILNKEHPYSFPIGSKVISKIKGISYTYADIVNPQYQKFEIIIDGTNKICQWEEINAIPF